VYCTSNIFYSNVSMKLRLYLLVLSFIVFSGNSASGQKLIKKMASDVCDCIVDLEEAFKGKDPSVILQTCFTPVVAKYEAQIRKKYGADIFDKDNNNKLYSIGVEVGKVMASDCPAYLELFISQQNNAKVYYDLGDKAYKEGNYKDAIQNYNEAISIDPENHEYFNSRGIVYFVQGEYYKAISDFMDAIGLRPDFALGYYNIAYSKYELGDYEKALIDAKKSRAMDTSYCNANNLIGLIYNAMDMTDSAYLSFETAYRCDSTSSLYAFNTAYLLYTNHKYSDAIVFFNKAINLEYENADMYSYLGNCYNNLEMYEDALLTHSTYIDLNENDYVGYYNRGITFKNMKQYESAIDDFNMAALKDSTDSDIYYRLAQCNEELDNLDEAKVLYDKAIQMNSDNAEYYDARALFHAQSGLFAEAIQDSKLSLDLYPNDCNIYKEMSKWYGALNQQEKAKEAREKALELGCDE